MKPGRPFAMRICRLTWLFPRQNELTHGLGPNFYYLSKEQAKLGNDVHVISSTGPSDPAYEEVDTVKVHRVTFPYNVNAPRKLEEIHKDSSVDVVHGHGTCGIFYPLLRLRIRRPLAVHVHGTTLELRRHFYSGSNSSIRGRRFLQEAFTILRQRYLWHRADLLVAVSGAVRRELIELYGIRPDKIVVVHNGIDPHVFKRRADANPLRRKLGLENRKVILFVGHFGPNKGLSVLIEAMSSILHKVPEASLVCVGGTPKWLGTHAYWEYLQHSIRSKGLESSIRLLAEVHHHDLPAYYSMADVFVLPSFYEAMGKVVLEAMACETPVVASRTGGIPEIVKDGTNGILVEPGDAPGLAESIVRLIQDEDLAHRMGLEAGKMVRSSYTWEHAARKLLKAYEKVL